MTHNLGQFFLDFLLRPNDEIIAHTSFQFICSSFIQQLYEEY